MDKQALIAQRDRLMQELNETNREIERLNKEIQTGKIKKVCDLLEELWKQTSEVFEIENYDGDIIGIDFEDLSKSIKKQFGIY
jgi:hypothetical protein